MITVLDRSDLDGIGIEGPMSTRAWAERYRIVKGGPVADQNPDKLAAWRTDATPHAGGIMDAMDDSEIDTVVVEGPTRLAKSEAAIVNPILKDLHEGRPVLYINATFQDCVKFWQDKLQPAIQASPVLRDCQRGEKDGGQMLHRLFLTGGILYMAGAGMIPAGFDAPHCYCDEVNKPGYTRGKGQEVNTIQLAKERASGYGRGRKLSIVCTVTTPEGEITRQFLSGDCRLFYVPCPWCGGYQVMEWSHDHAGLTDGHRYPDWDYPHGSMIFDDSSTLAARQSARYVCGLCQCEIPEDHKRWMVSAGLWTRKGCHVEVMERGEGEALFAPFEESALPEMFYAKEAGEPDVKTTKASFHFNALVSLIVPWGDLAKEFVEAKQSGDEEAIRSFQRSRLAIPCRGILMDASEIKEAEVMDHMRQSNYLSGRQGRMPFKFDPKTVKVTAGVDIGKRNIHCTVDAWVCDAAGFLDRSYRLLILTPLEVSNPDSPRGIFDALCDLRAMLQEGWVDAEGGPIRLTAAGIDTGYQDTKQRKVRVVEGADHQVYEFCQLHGQRTWCPVKGASDTQDGQLIKASILEERKIQLWLIDTDLAKIEIHQQLRVAPGEAGYWHLPQDAPRQYARGLCAERRIVELDANLAEKATWQRTDPYNHPLDCEVYSWAIARALGVKPPASRRIIDATVDKQATAHAKKQVNANVRREDRPTPGRGTGGIRTRY